MARILVIDDENNIRMMVRLALQHVGHSVETAADGMEGIRVFGEGEKWDLVLLDQRMPGMEGLEVLRQIRRVDPNSRVIMITAFGTIDLAVDAMKAGAHDFLRKPFTADTLRGAVAATLNARAFPSSERTTGESPLKFSLSTINGYWIESAKGSCERDGGDLTFRFAVTSPANEMQECDVTLPAYLTELVRAEVDREEMPGGDRFWQALCEEVLANYVWQHSDFPPHGTLVIEGLTTSLRRWIDAVVSSGQETPDGKAPH